MVKKREYPGETCPNITWSHIYCAGVEHGLPLRGRQQRASTMARSRTVMNPRNTVVLLHLLNLLWI
jgi:hypothetical protein